MIASLKAHFSIIVGNILAWFGTISANQMQIEWSLKVLSYLFAILVSTLTAAHIIRNWTKDHE